ncbi:MAG: sigma-70 family RNA polymerase sigma factor [Candidatus Cloacimonetes bacterium]|nr:sigma-70 family RNA polymerase sigma factor [Candidatus Cloacimonadota bacterium]MBS3767785.1 sigma-70 family RNA polymerase sigma factor [Candidatus Cloacimonadota bacterium]
METKEINLEKKAIKKAKRDRDAFDFLYRKYFSRINNFVFHRVKDKDVKDEIVSNTFFKAMNKIDTFELEQYQENTFSAWLFRIAISEIGNFFRTEKKHRKVKKAIHHNQHDGKEINRQIDFETVCKKLRNLSEYEQNLITLRFFEKLKHKEIANILQQKTNTIRVQIHRTLKKLHKFLEDNNYDKKI